MTLTVTLDPGGPYDPELVLEAAEVFAELARRLNHATRHHDALRDPGEADRLIRSVELAASRLPQLLGQVSHWLAAEQAAGRLSGDVAAAMLRLGSAGITAETLSRDLNAAAEVTAGIAPKQEGDANG